MSFRVNKAFSTQEARNYERDCRRGDDLVSEYGAGSFFRVAAEICRPMTAEERRLAACLGDLDWSVVDQ